MSPPAQPPPAPSPAPAPVPDPVPDPVPAPVPASGIRRIWPLWVLVAITCLPELILLLADNGILGTTRWRPLSYQYGAFWGGLLRDWQPNFPAQPWTMFGSYALLHVGPEHLAGNVLALIWLGTQLWPETGALRFMALYVGTVLGGALGFVLLNHSPAPMVGASGALFGLAAAAIVQHWKHRRQRQDGPGEPDAQTAPAGPLRAGLEALGLVAALVALNLAAELWQGTPVAWQTHLGGALTGAVLALLILPWPRPAAPPV